MPLQETITFYNCDSLRGQRRSLFARQGRNGNSPVPSVHGGRVGHHSSFREEHENVIYEPGIGLFDHPITASHLNSASDNDVSSTDFDFQ